MESQFGLANVWLQGDFVTRAVAVILPAVAGPIIAVAALILALVWHLRARQLG